VTPDQAATHILRTAAFLVWLVYLLVLMRHRVRLRDGLTVAIVVLYTGGQAWRAAFFPGAVLLEFTVVSMIALLAGIAFLTVRK
jgi:hypothetical protein